MQNYYFIQYHTITVIRSKVKFMTKYRKHVLMVLLTSKLYRNPPPGTPVTCIKNFSTAKEFHHCYLINHYQFFSQGVGIFINLPCREETAAKCDFTG